MRSWRKTESEVPRRVPAAPRRAGVRRGDRQPRLPAVDADGGLRRSDARHRTARPGPVASRLHPPGPRAGMPGLRHPRGVDRQGGGDCRAPRGHLLFLRRHVARSRQRLRPAVRQGAGGRRAHSLFAVGRLENRGPPSRPAGGVLRGGIRDHGAGQRHGRVSRPAAGHRQLLDAGLPRPGPAGDGGHSRLPGQPGAGLPGRGPRLHGDGLHGVRADRTAVRRPDRGHRLRTPGHSPGRAHGRQAVGSGSCGRGEPVRPHRPAAGESDRAASDAGGVRGRAPQVAGRRRDRRQRAGIAARLYAELDAETRFGVAGPSAEEAAECISGLILQGRKRPTDCPAFGGCCRPEHPLGATMVSAEGACAAYYAHRRMGVAP